MSSGSKPTPQVVRRAMRTYHAKHRDKILAKKRARYAANKERELARWARHRNTPEGKARAKLRYAVWSGKITKPAACESCGKEDRLYGHHDDYAKPLEVRWLCSICHGRLSRKD